MKKMILLQIICIAFTLNACAKNNYFNTALTGRQDDTTLSIDVIKDYIWRMDDFRESGSEYFYFFEDGIYKHLYLGNDYAAEQLEI